MTDKVDIFVAVDDVLKRIACATPLLPDAAKVSAHRDAWDQWLAEQRNGAKPARKRHVRKPTLASVAKQASKAGIEVARYEVKPDGTVVVVTGKTDTEQTDDLDNWIAKHADTGQRH